MKSCFPPLRGEGPEFCSSLARLCQCSDVHMGRRRRKKEHAEGCREVTELELFKGGAVCVGALGFLQRRKRDLVVCVLRSSYRALVCFKMEIMIPVSVPMEISGSSLF